MYYVDIITTSRADFTLWLPIIHELNNNNKVKLRVIVTGTHYLDSSISLDEVFTKLKGINYVEIKCTDSSKVNEFMSEIFNGYMNILDKGKIDLALVLGDRYELLAILNALILNRVPIGHYFPGECDVSYCIDTQVRDAITKAAHVFFVSHKDIKKRLQVMGEEEWRIAVTGRCSTDGLQADKRLLFDFLNKHNINYDRNKIVNCCYHPPTIMKDLWKKELPNALVALDNYSDYTFIWTGVNSDPDSKELKEYLLKEISKRKNHYFFEHLGGDLYHSLLSCSKFMIGNSSSGLHEAPLFKLPVVNIGCRQSGRLHSNGVIDCSSKIEDIEQSIKLAINYDREKICYEFSQKDFPFNFVEHLINCLNKKDLMIKQLPKIDYTLQRVPEYL